MTSFFRFGVLCLFLLWGYTAQAVRIATINVNNYSLTGRQVEGHYRRNYPKPEKDKAALREVVRTINPDIIVLQELGGPAYLQELQRDLRREGQSYLFAHCMVSVDNDHALAILSKVPPIAVREHKKIVFNYQGGQRGSKRGLLETVFGPPDKPWSLFNLHLKSRLDASDDPESADWRRQEAKALSRVVRQQCPWHKRPDYIIAGDFNDYKNSRPLRYFIHQNKKKATYSVPAFDSRGETWTQYYRARDVYSRFDFILLSAALQERYPDLVATVVDSPAMLQASDHRMVFFDIDLPLVAAKLSGKPKQKVAQ